jgi:DNA primase
MNTADKICDALDLREVMEHYGIEFNNKGFCHCFMHKEKTASMSIKNNHYKCFGCGAYGGVVDFVMEYCGVSFKQALVRLDSEFHLGIISNKKPTLRERKYRTENRRIEQAKHNFEQSVHENYLRLCSLHSVLYRQLITGKNIEGLQEYIDRLSAVLDDFTEQEARAWMK